jgi:hypothetical protein
MKATLKYTSRNDLDGFDPEEMKEYIENVFPFTEYDLTAEIVGDDTILITGERRDIIAFIREFLMLADEKEARHYIKDYGEWLKKA